MEASNLELTSDLLMDELVKWHIKYGKGRNENDLRFGQFIWAKYDVGKLFTEPDGGIDGFATENPVLAFEQISAKL